MLDWFAEKWNEFKQFMLSLLKTLIDILLEVFYIISEAIVSGLITVLDGVSGVLDTLDVTQYISALPAETAQALGYLQIGSMLGVIVSCLTIRLLMQLIPFVGLGRG